MTAEQNIETRVALLEMATKHTDYVMAEAFRVRDDALVRTANSLQTELVHLNALRTDVVKDREMFLAKDYFDKEHNEAIRRIELCEKWQAKLMGMGLAVAFGCGLLGYAISHFSKP
jgi:hypothetical protein